MTPSTIGAMRREERCGVVAVENGGARDDYRLARQFHVSRGSAGERGFVFFPAICA